MADEPKITDAEEGAVNVEIPGDGITPAEPQKKVETAPGADTKPVVQEGVSRKTPEEDEAFKTLQQTADTERRRREAAEATAAAERNRADNEAARRHQREQELGHAREAAEATELARLDDGIGAATRELTSLQGELKNATEAANFEKVAEITTKITRAAARLDRLEATKETYEANRGKQSTHEGRVEERQAPPVQGTPFEQYVSGFTPAAQNWLRAHPDCVPEAATINGRIVQLGGNAQRNAAMMEGHYKAISKLGRQGLDTPEYFKIIEETVNPPAARKPETEDPNKVHVSEHERAKPQQRQATPAAPPSRDVPGGTPNPGASQSVRLTKEEQEAAMFSFPNLTKAQAFAAYARNKVELTAEGKIGRTHV